MSPKVRPKEKTWSQEVDEAFEREVDAELNLIKGQDKIDYARHTVKIAVADVSPYGARSPHSWILDSAALASGLTDPAARERPQPLQVGERETVRG
jgi:hypothetical protein